MTTLNPDQQAALAAITEWLLAADDSKPFFVLSGSAGTGKTFCIRELTNSAKGRFIFTAPTNKATKVLRESVTTDDYKPECRTIYSLLGLRMEANGELKELKAPEDPIDLSHYRAVIVDEGSMVNKQVLQYIAKTASDYHLKFLLLGDPAQLPPVGELVSPIWEIPDGSKLTKVMRHDNEILNLATAIRGQVNAFSPTIKLASANSNDQGIWKLTAPQFAATVREHALAGGFSIANGSKLISWRNVEVDKWNAAIRNMIFPGVTAPWLVGDRVLFAGPARDLDDEPMASTDDEGEITRVEEEWSVIWPEFKTWRIAITLDDNKPVIARVLHEESRAAFVRRSEELAAAARANSRKWKDFWDFKDSFHLLKYAYAITAHRSQGSTYDTAFVNWQDILLNRNRQEAFRCLYVAITRPRRVLVLS